VAHKATDEEFVSQWNQASAWAEANDIPQQSLAPVYQYDLGRLQAGDYPMSQAERIRAIQAAANPNDVTPVPSDKPQPSNVFGNARRDLGMIFTGLEPNHLIANLWDTTTNTIKDIADPKRLEGKNLGTTMANFLQNTLASFVPGAYDIGTVLRADPTLSGDAGFKALADDPLIAIMDLLPADAGGGLTKLFAKTDLGAALAAHLDMTPTEFAGSSIHKMMLKLPTSMTKVDPAGGSVGKLTVGDWIQTRLQDSVIGTSKPVHTLAKMFELNAQHFSSIKQTILQPFVDASSDLDDAQQAQVADIIARNQVGQQNLQTLLDDPSVDPAVRKAVVAFFDGPIRFAREEAVASHDVTPVRRLDGSMGLYTATQDQAVTGAREALQGTHRALLDEMERDDPLLTQVQQIEAAIPKIGQVMEQANQAARKVTETNPELLKNATEAYRAPGAKRDEIRNFGQKRDLARKLFGADGMVDDLIRSVKAGDHDRVTELAPIVVSRLQRWGAYSVDASADESFQGVLKAARMLVQAEKRKGLITNDLNRRIVGDARRTDLETAAMRDQRASELADQKASQASDRAAHFAARRRELDMIRTSHSFKIDHFNRLYEQMKEAALVKGDNEAGGANFAFHWVGDELRPGPGFRVTKAEADSIYARVKNDIDGLAQTRREAIRKADRERDEATKAAKARWDKTKDQLSQMHRAQRAQLLEEHAAQREIDGELTRKSRAYLRTLREFHKAVYDHPTDNWRDMRYQVYAQHLIDGLHNAELVEATEKRLRERSNLTEDRVEEIKADPQRLREAVVQTMEDVFTNPANFDPELVDTMDLAKKEAQKSAIDEINRLQVEGYRPEWIPAVNPKDRPSMGVKAKLGTDHDDVAFRRSNEMVNTRYDLEAAASKAVTQALRRDASIQLLDDLAPQVMTGTQLRDRMDEFGVLEGFDPKSEHLEHAYAVEIEKMGLTEFNPREKFKVSMPRWEGERLFLPTGLKKALDKMMDLQEKTHLGLYDKGTDLFRFSILGLSPRYTAHIAGGGMMMLALRSTPYMPFMLRDAYRALKDGTIPLDTFTHPSEEGYSRMARAVQEHSRAAGKQGAFLALQEHVEQVQKVAMSKASPIHWLKAAADMNMRFTRFVNNLYRATAYLDYSAKAERRGTFVDELTGEEVQMTKERAMAEGQKHAIAVFGDMRLMSPFERQFMPKIFPFYGWTRHILSYVTSFPVDHPWRAQMLSLMAFENSANVPKGLPERIQFLLFLGSPNAQGNVTAVDDRFLDPFRDTANYASLGGWLEGLNPALLAPLVMTDPSFVYGGNQLYPNLSYDQFYGISEAGAQGSPISGLEQFVPQLGALATGGPAIVAAIKKAGQWRAMAGRNPNAFYKSIFEDLNIPFAQVQKLNVKQIAVSDEIARYDVAKGAATTAFQTGDFSPLAAYSSVPNPLNPDYEVTPAQLQAVYQAALQAYPGLPPVESVTPPPTPAGI